MAKKRTGRKKRAAGENTGGAFSSGKKQGVKAADLAAMLQDPLFSRFVEDTKTDMIEQASRNAQKDVLNRYYKGILPKRADQEAFLESEQGKEMIRAALDELGMDEAALAEGLISPFLTYRPTLEAMHEEGMNLTLKGVQDEYVFRFYDEIRAALEGTDPAALCRSIEESLRKILQKKIADYLKKEQIDPGVLMEFRRRHTVTENTELSRDTIGSLADALEYPDEEAVCAFLGRKHELLYYAQEELLHRLPQLHRFYRKEYGLTRRFMEEELLSYFNEDRILSALGRHFKEKEILRLLQMNPRYEGIAEEYIRDEYNRRFMPQNIVSAMPEHYPDLYPATRALERHFILHIGPTNSGKTHDAMYAMMMAETGVYYGPLRLMAYEQYERLAGAGLDAYLLTGEEAAGSPLSHYQSSTIEMMNPEIDYEVAVIDEAQMIADPERGGGWSAAIMGVQARTVHVCMAPEAKEIVIRIIESCGDTYEVVEHQRMTSLEMDSSRFTFPNSVEDGDALIVFSRANVHAVAAELQKTRDIRCSIIYGALPYDVRHEEARKFREGETKILVTTDAVGMGLNLPIRRVVFLETTKFDGRQERPLQPQEVKQIGGRAGRFGIFDNGYVNADQDKRMVRHHLAAQLPPILDAVIGFPEPLLGIPGRISDIMRQWNSMEPEEGFVKADMHECIRLCIEAEKVTEDRDLIYNMAMIPFDIEKAELMRIWRDMVDEETLGRAYKLEQAHVCLPDDLDGLEAEYRKCDLLYSYMRRMHHPEEMAEVMEFKKELAGKMISILSQKRLAGKICRNCGKPLAWNFPFGICDSCRSKMRRRRR
ncbi:MAG: DEAD/DEAH box helicase [Lachnospiraceae bacterium]|nr:DEAD/DEAH box helicase [Lachnospiraceae bacterium]